MFTIYHLHQPWSMPGSAARRNVRGGLPLAQVRSTWIALASHTAPSFLIIGVVLFMVL
jgi:hypothetical protein